MTRVRVQDKYNVHVVVCRVDDLISTCVLVSVGPPVSMPNAVGARSLKFHFF